MRGLLVSLMVIFTAGCGDLQHDNPFDPQTPPDQQARTSFAGSVTLEPVGGVTPPLEGIQVSVAGSSYAAVTDAAGAYAITGVPPGSYTVQAVLADYETASVTGVTATLDTGGATVAVPPLALKRVRADLAGSVDLLLPDTTLETTGGALVTLEGAGGALPTGLTVGALSRLGGATSSALGAAAGSALTDETGAFVIPDVPAPLGSYTLTASKLGYVTKTSVVTYAAGGFVVETVQLAIDPGALVGSVTVIGAPDSAGVVVRARGATLGGTPWEDAIPSDAAGTFRLSGLPAGTYAVSYELADHVTVTTSATVSPGADTTLLPVELVRETGAIAGTIELAGAASSAGAVVTASGPIGTASTVTDEAGTFNLQGVGVGTWTVVARKDPDWQPVTVPGVVVTRNAPTPLGTIPLAPIATASLGGRVLLEGTASPAGTTVTLRGADFRGVVVPAGTTTVSDDNGDWSFPALVAGSYQVSFDRASFDVPAPIGVSLQTGQAVSVGTVTLPLSRGTLYGTASLSAGAITGFSVGTDFAGAVVTLTGPDLAPLTTVTDSAGGYRFERVPVHPLAAAYTVTASRPWFTSQSVDVVALANATRAAGAMTLPVAHGALTGVATLTNVPGGGDGLASAGVVVSITGTAFNGAAFSAAAVTDAAGAWTSDPLPPGTYDVLATADDRRCDGYARVSVPSGPPTSAGAVLCLDAAPPTGLVLGTPEVTPPQLAGFTASTSFTVPIDTPAGDPTAPSNLSEYELAIGPTPDWTTAARVPATPVPASLTFDGLAPDARNVLWARAIDAAGNAGPAATLEVVQDSQDPPPPTLSTARDVVDGTSAAVTISGSETDANFYLYQAATATRTAVEPCPGDPDTAFTSTTASAAVSLAVDQKTCFYARAVDRAGRTSTASVIAITSDMTPPTGPTVAPLFDPTTVTLHADFVDFRIMKPARDLPAGTVDWDDIAWVEADTGSGFSAICPAPECRPEGVYNPCACACDDPRRVCNGTTFAAIRMPLNGGTANNFAVRAVDVAGNVGSGASQEVRTSGVVTSVAISDNGETQPRVRGRTLTYSLGSSGVVVDLGANARWDATDASCNIGSIQSYEMAIVPLDSNTIVYSTGSAVRVRRRLSDWCTGYSDTPIGARSAANFTIYAVAATLDPTGRLERVAWAENDYGNKISRVWLRDPGSGGKIDAADAPAALQLYEKTGVYTTRVQLGGDVLVARQSTSLLQFINGTYMVYHRPSTGWDPANPVTFSLADAPAALGAAVNADGSLLAWEGSDGKQTIHVAKPGPDGIYGTADDAALRWTKETSGTTSYADVTVEGGHVVTTEYLGTLPSYLNHWSAGPDGQFGTADDNFARLLPSSSGRVLPSLGDGLGAGVVYYAQIGGDNYDVQMADLSAFRWDTLSDVASAVYPRTNREGTYFFIKTDGVWAKAPDGQETKGFVSSSFYAADGGTFAAEVGKDVWVYEADAEGRFFTAAAPAGVRVLTGKAGYGWGGVSIAIGVGDGRVLLATCEASSGTTCTEKGITLLEPSPTAGTPVVIRIDRPADGAPANTATSSNPSALGASAWHAVYPCSQSAPTVLNGALCVREPGPNGKFEPVSSPTYDDVSFVLPIPGAPGTWYTGLSGVKVDGHRIAFFDAGQVKVVEAGSSGSLAAADARQYVVGPTTEYSGQFFEIAGDFVAWLSYATGGLEPFVGDVRAGTLRQQASHYSAKYGISVDRTGRAVWADDLFSAKAVFTNAP